MERTLAVAALVAEAQGVARDLGFEVGEAATGGAGDANTTAAAGLPTIDGLAPVGGDAHGPDEWLDLESVVPRTALLAGLLARSGPERSAASHGRFWLGTLRPHHRITAPSRHLQIITTCRRNAQLQTANEGRIPSQATR